MNIQGRASQTANSSNRALIASLMPQRGLKGRVRTRLPPQRVSARGTAKVSPESYKQQTMAGHSKFKNIMHRKGAQDKKR
ncbi:hypothetical protein, partial [Novosphingobium sp.]|uniref:hypothetical protein n=1 Tax=Novosphingobium sp. TaxID=1874826 RepID=UPI002626E345